MWQPAHPSANKHKNPCIRTHQKKQQFKDLIPLPSAQQTLPSQEKQIDRRHEMIGEEFDGKKVCSHVSLNKQPFHSRKGSRRHKQILTAQNRKIQRTCAPFHKPKKREATPAEPPFPPVQKQVGWIQGTYYKWYLCNPEMTGPQKRNPKERCQLGERCNRIWVEDMDLKSR